MYCKDSRRSLRETLRVIYPISAICIRKHLQAFSLKPLARQIAGDAYFTTQYIADENAFIRGAQIQHDSYGLHSPGITELHTALGA